MEISEVLCYVVLFLSTVQTNLLVHGSMGFSGQLSKHNLVVVNHPLDMSLCSTAESAISVSNEVTTRMALGFLNILQLAVPWSGPNYFRSLLTVLTAVRGRRNRAHGSRVRSTDGEELSRFRRVATLSLAIQAW